MPRWRLVEASWGGDEKKNTHLVAFSLTNKVPWLPHPSVQPSIHPATAFVFQRLSYLLSFLMCEIIGPRQGWAATSRLALSFSRPALNTTPTQKCQYAHTGTEGTDKSGVVMIALSVIMMTLVVMKSVKSTMAVITSAAPALTDHLNTCCLI